MSFQTGVEAEDSEKVSSVVDRLLESAERIFLEKGFVSATMDEVASAAGMSKKTVYKHFGSKTDLFRAVLMRPHRKSWMQLRLADAETPHERIEGVLLAIAAFIFSPKEVALQRLIVREARIAPDIAEFFASLIGDPDPLGLVGVLREIPGLMGREPEDLAFLAQMLMGMAFGAFHFKLMVSDVFRPPDNDLRRHIGKAVQIFLDGLGKENA